MEGFEDWADSIGNTDDAFKLFCRDLNAGKVTIDDVDEYMAPVLNAAATGDLSIIKEK